MSLDIRTVPPAWTDRWATLSDNERFIIALSTMVTGIGDLTRDKDLIEYVARIRTLEKVGLAPMGQRLHPTENKIEQVVWTDEDLFSLRGLRTNVFPTEARKSWVARMFGSVVNDAHRDATRAAAKLAEQALAVSA